MNRKILIIFLLTVGLFFSNLSTLLSQPELEISGIVVEEDKEPFAIVDGSIVREGDYIDGLIEVVEITKDGVKFKYGDTIYEEKISTGTSELSESEWWDDAWESVDRETSQKENEHYYNAIYYFEEACLETYLSPRLNLLKKAIQEARWAYSTATSEQKQILDALIRTCREHITKYENALILR